MRKYGQTIITGFLDENHSLKNLNFVRSWQDRFDTNNIDLAIEKCLNQKTHFDHAWKEETGEFYSNGDPKYILMTEVTMPLFKQYKEEEYMMFPRIAYNPPSLINGNRQFLIGKKEVFTKEEMELLLKIFWMTREGCYQENGDLLLINNMFYAHSREPYLETKDKTRSAVVIMSEEFLTDR